MVCNIYIIYNYVIMQESELHHSIGSLIDRAHPGPKTDRDYMYVALARELNIYRYTIILIYV